MTEPALRIGFAAEGPTDVRVGPGLGDKVIQHGRDWIAEELLSSYRVWAGLEGEPFFDLHLAMRRARDAGLRVHGHIGGLPRSADAGMCLAVLRLFADLPAEQRPQLVVILRDLDQQSDDRRQGALQAKSAYDWPFDVVFAHPDPEIEAWILVGWVPRDEQEHRRLASLRAELGHDPTTAPERLTASTHGARRDIKRVLDGLDVAGDAEQRLFAQTLEVLRERGQTCGLTDYLARLAEVFDRHLGHARD